MAHTLNAACVMELVQDYLGHSDMLTTKIYVKYFRKTNRTHLINSIPLQLQYRSFRP
ncbi:hypothetical protein DN757_27230 [Paenibacillus silvae]|uniref:Uncharacterized protein n=1 Tax=Paenibacillus silvae TaxID=1325358 RepID=A0A2W6NYB7_9BACL|nr:hypothetical protein DN757_27230 [Paenibacillus silvae]